MHHISKCLPQPEISWEALAAARAGMVSLLQEGTTVGATGMKLARSSQREISTGSPSLLKVSG